MTNKRRKMKKRQQKDAQQERGQYLSNRLANECEIQIAILRNAHRQYLHAKRNGDDAGRMYYRGAKVFLLQSVTTLYDLYLESCGQGGNMHYFKTLIKRLKFLEQCDKVHETEGASL